MNTGTLSKLEQLHRQYTQSKTAAKPKLFEAISELLTAYFAAEERALQGHIGLSFTDFHTNYLAARTFDELRKLEPGSTKFDRKLNALCRQLGVLAGSDGNPPTPLLKAA